MDALGQVTSYQYDPAGRKVFESRPSVMGQSSTTHDIRYEYDDADRLVKETHISKSGGGYREIYYAYDAFDRLVSKTLMKGSEIEDFASYTYENQLDAKSLASANNGVANLSFTNEASPPFAITGYAVEAAESGNPKGLIEDTFTVSRDATGNIAGISGTSSGEIFTKAYDPAGRLIGFNAGNALRGAISYDGFGRKEKISYSDGTSGTYAYDLLNRVTAINWKEKYKDSVRQHLTYDLAGNVSRMAREHSTYDLSYDAADQLTKSVFKGLQGVPGYNREFGYDGVGNRLSDSHNGPGSFVSNFLTQNGASSFTASSDGFGEVAQEVTGDKVKNYTYRADGKVASFSSGALSVNYHYDGLDRLIAKVINENGNAYTQSFAHLGKENRVLLGKAGDGSVTTYIDGQGPAERLGEVKSGVGKGYITDHLGSVLNSPIASSWKSYGLFGENFAPMAISPAASPVMYGYAGGKFNPETGDTTFGVRELDHNTGRWTTQDPIGLSGNDANFYRYVKNNSLKYVDYTGNGLVMSCPGSIDTVAGVN